MVASMNASQIRAVVSGSAKPSVVNEEPLISKARCQASDPVPQKMKVKATTMSSIQTNGRLTSATGAYNDRSATARSRDLERWTSRRWTTANTPCSRRGRPSWGRTTVLSAEPRIVRTRAAPKMTDRTCRAIIVGGRVLRSGDLFGGGLHGLVDPVLVDLQFLRHALARLQRRLLQRRLHGALPDDDERRLAGVDDVAELLHVSARHALPQMTAHAAERGADQCGADDGGREQD